MASTDTRRLAAANEHALAGGPVFRIRPHAVARAARWFADAWPGETFYAVKANPEPWAIRAVLAGGVTGFDVASLKEVRDVRALAPDATLAFMHPIKPEAAIREAYFDHGVRIFALDHEEELEKIADDLTIDIDDN